MTDPSGPIVELSIDAAHTMPHLERATRQFENTIAETLARVGYAGGAVIGSILKAVHGNSFRGIAGVSVKGYPEVSKRTMTVIVQPSGLGNEYCILCRLTIDGCVDLIDLFEKIMAANQPKRVANYTKSKQTGISVSDQIVDEKPTSWAIDSISFSPHPNDLADDLDNMKIILAEITEQADKASGIINAEILFNLILGCCCYNPDHCGDEITAEVVEYLADEILPTWVYYGYLASVELEDGLCDYKLGPAAIELLSEKEELPEQNPMIEKARQAKLQAKLVIDDSAKKMHRGERKIKELKGTIIALQSELDALNKEYELDRKTHTDAKARHEHATRASELIQRASEELKKAEDAI